MRLTSSQLAELALLLFASRAESDLEGEADEGAALRKAVLVLAALNQDNQSAASKQFSRYILTSFKPLLSHLDHLSHEIWDGHTIGIRVNSDGEPLVAIKRDTVNALMEDFAREDARVQREALLQLTARSSGEAPWSITEDRFVGFFDVMGFSALVGDAEDDHGQLYSVMRGLHDAARLAEKLLAQGDLYSQVLSRSAAPPGQLKVVQFSDSIVVITEDASPASSLLIQRASQVFFLHALRHGIILRGAVARGIVTADFPHSIFFGQAIVDAYRLEEVQQWYGIAIHPSAERGEPADAPQLGNDEIPVVETFGVDLRGQETPEQLSVINWPVFADSLEMVEELLQPFDGTGSRGPEKLSAYHRKTLAFAQAMWRKYRGLGKAAD